MVLNYDQKSYFQNFFLFVTTQDKEIFPLKFFSNIRIAKSKVGLLPSKIIFS